MLPYHLRAPVYGDKEKTLRRRRDGIPQTEHDGGGPIQMAITNDLINLRELFRKKILNDLSSSYHQTTNNQQQVTTSDNNDVDNDNIHWKSGTAFLIFKDIFRSSRIAMIHLLPPALCDREAYTQLIYAACLTLFKESFEQIVWKNIDDDDEDLTDNDNDGNDDNEEKEKEKDDDSTSDSYRNHHDDAGFALFSLLALFETNPLPRKIGDENPLELLPISLRSLGDDPRSSFRRCFSQNIRIDRQHYAMLLRLKELSRAKKCDCERHFYEIFKYKEKTKIKINNNKDQQGFSWNTECRCGMSTDILEIIERIVPRLELCEYIGPIGVEGFAGHADYPYKKQHDNCKTTHQECNRVQSQSVAEKETEGGYSIESSSELLSNEIVSLMRNYQNSITAIRIPSSKLKPNAVKRLQKILEPVFKSNNNERRDNINNANGLSSIGSQNRSFLDDGPEASVSGKYKVTTHEIDGNLKKHLHASLMFLLKRDEPIPLQSELAHHSLSKTSLAMDDASSIGHGGISVGTNQGQVAIQNLLSAVAGKNIIRKFRSKKKLTIEEEETSTEQNLANIFLTSNNQAIDSVESPDDDEDSVDSELTALSFSNEEYIHEDDDISVVSVATSAFGTKALEDLLQTVAQEVDNGKRAKRKSVTKKAKKQKKKKRTENDQDDEISVATSAFGTKALEDLLHTVAQQETNDDVIIPAGKTKRKSIKRKTKNQKKKVIAQDDEISVATSACGAKALENLLQTVAQEEEKDDGDFIIPARRTKQRKSAPKKAKKQKKSTFEHNQDDEISVATSTLGINALEDLLQTVNQEEC